MLSERVAFTPGITSTATEGRLYVISGQSLCVAYASGGGEPQVPVGPVPRSALFLGELDGAACFARLLVDGEPPPEGTDPIALRQLFGALPDDDFAIAGRALGLTAWDRDHRYCGRCGAGTERSQTDRVRTCTRCGHAAYPRLSPAIIALVERDGRALLGDPRGGRRHRQRHPLLRQPALAVHRLLDDRVHRALGERRDRRRSERDRRRRLVRARRAAPHPAPAQHRARADRRLRAPPRRHLARRYLRCASRKRAARE
ncbi:MAG: hypothetical protein E6J91_01925 [Deltaproteobacteria bacterium]|nr:MAG: hypothetical protein E6J91_01925 [Deltaproteobacteria bacterium]